MNARTKLCWVDIPRRSLREGLACGQGGARVMLLMDDERPSVSSAAAASPCDTRSEARPREKPR